MRPNDWRAARASLRHWTARLLDPTSRSLAARLVRYCNMFLIAVGLSGVIVESDDTGSFDRLLLIIVPLFAFIAEYLVRLWVVPDLTPCEGESDTQIRRRWVRSPRGIVDLAGAALIPVGWCLGLEGSQAGLFGVLWVFKLARYSQGLAVLVRVIRLEAEPLVGVLFAFLVVLLCAAVLAHVLEGPTQPAVFGTVAKSLWWTIVTLTTTGYGDVTPVTPGGRVLGGLVMMCGIIVFALWAGILATGFSQEMRRRAFLRTWDLVARVPLFQHVGAAVIAEVAQRLRPFEVDPGTVVVRRGDIGDCMYFIVSGDIEVRMEAGDSLHLKDGDFFGELALITGARRSATTVAAKLTQLLVLDIADFRDLAARHPGLTDAIHLEARRRLHQGAETDHAA